MSRYLSTRNISSKSIHAFLVILLTDRQRQTRANAFTSSFVGGNSTRLLSLCATHSLSVLGSWFKRKDIYRHSWICNDGYTRKELDHILINDRSFFKSIRVFRGAEPLANSDHRLVVATAALQPYRATRKSFKPQLDSTLLTR